MLSQTLTALKSLPYNFLTLNYPITRRFPWRWFGPLVLLASIPVIALLTALNIFTVGTETVTYESSEYHTGSTWLYDLAGQQAPTVYDPARLRIGDTFRTNFGSFDYTLVAINGTGGSKAAKAEAPTRRSFDNPSYGFAYSGADVASSCYSTSNYSDIFLRYVSLSADVDTFTVQGEVAFFCLVADGAVAQLVLSHLTQPFLFRPSAYHSNLRGGFRSLRSLYHDIVEDLVDRMALDLLQSMRLASSPENDTSLAQVSLTGTMTCRGGSASDLGSLYSCPLYDKAADLVNNANSRLEAGGRSQFVELASMRNLPAGLSESINNYLSSLYLSNLLDLGVWSTNPLLSAELFNHTILPNDALTAALTREPFPDRFYVGSSAAQASLLVYNQTQAESSRLREPPTFFVNDTLSTDSNPAWAVSYTCRRTGLKKPLGLTLSVLIGDVALFGLIWGFFMYLPTNIAQRRENTCSACGSGATGATAPLTSSP
ncbi:hypothetical protein BCR35DRAFT_332284 [Leucosporidium creatinivorum]|uniref:Uncharacterized protein n=1 Tax=Leucosporidium creatinivorum TaxID=106004 RepID=A0A1Y2F3E8_9BASI|nr:hypothetical protein BCR35DRAFT_332284 [Leucosporidium creatinivorum]